MQLKKFLITPQTTKFTHQNIFWFTLSMTFAFLYGMLSLQQAFSTEYVIQDDVRQHVFWMQRFLDPALFPDDLIADFYQSVAPWGYTIFYQIFTVIGIDPILLSKVLPTILGLIITGYFFGISMEIFPFPAGAFIATLVFNQTIWKRDDIASATPRAFGLCLLVVFLYYLLHYEAEKSSQSSLLQKFANEIFPCLLVIGLIGAFHPQYIFICIGLIILQLFNWQNSTLRFSKNNQDYWLFFLCLGIAILVMLPYLLKVSDFGPVITGEQAKLLPEFYEGRTRFFQDNLWSFYINGSRSGILPRGLLAPSTMVFGLLLPLLIKFPKQFTLVKYINPNIKILPKLLITSIALFVTAHALLFKLYLPSRYTNYSLRIVLALATGITIITLLDVVLRWARREDKSRQKRKILTLLLTGLLAAIIILHPLLWKTFPNSRYLVGTHQSLYQFLVKQSKDIVIASLAEEASNIPSFTKRSVLVAWEYGIPYQLGYYKKFSQRATDLIQAQYSADIKVIENFINTYGIKFFLIERDAFTSEYMNDNLFFKQWQPLAKQALANLENNPPPVMLSRLKDCSLFESDRLILLEANCVVK